MRASKKNDRDTSGAHSSGASTGRFCNGDRLLPAWFSQGITKTFYHSLFVTNMAERGLYYASFGLQVKTSHPKIISHPICALNVVYVFFFTLTCYSIHDVCAIYGIV